MISISIGEETATKDDMATLLEIIAQKVRDGYTSGFSPDWDLSGEAEDLDLEEEEEEDKIEPEFEIGDRVRVASDNDNMWYDSFRDKVLIITKVSTSREDHPGFDESVGEALYDLKDEDENHIGCSLYEYELEEE